MVYHGKVDIESGKDNPKVVFAQVSSNSHLTHAPLIPHIWVSVGLGNGLSPVRRQAITWTNAGLLSIRRMRTNLSEIRNGILSFSFEKMHFKLSSAKMEAVLSSREMS